MEFKNPFLIYYNYKFLSAYRFAKRTIGQYLGIDPIITIQIELAGYCSANCEFCDWIRRPKEQKVLMDTTLAKKAVQNARDLNAIQMSFHVTGESLLHPDLLKIIPKDYHAVLSTNCLALEGELAKELSQMPNLFIVLAVLWAESQEKREKSLRNAVAFLNLNPKCRAISAQMVCSERAALFQERAYKVFSPYLEKLPALFLHFKIPFTQEPEYPTEGYPAFTIPEIPNRIQVDRLPTPQSCGADCLAFPPSPTTDMIVQSDGQIKPCFYRWPYWGLGNIRDATLREAWESERMKEIRDNWSKGDPDNKLACHDCIRMAIPKGKAVWFGPGGSGNPPARLSDEQKTRGRGEFTSSEKYKRKQKGIIQKVKCTPSKYTWVIFGIHLCGKHLDCRWHCKL